jgi:rubrerythrin
VLIRGTKMPTKQTDAVKYLVNCRNLEYATYSLYSAVTKKLKRPEINCILRGIAQDCFKHTKIIEELFKPLSFASYESGKNDKNYNKLSSEIRKYTNNLTPIEVFNDDEMPDLLNDLTEIEDCLSDFYSYFIDSQMLKQFTDQLSTVTDITEENLLFILKILKIDKLKHRNMLVETLHFYKESKLRNRDTTPLVRFQNPDAWIHY